MNKYVAIFALVGAFCMCADALISCYTCSDTLDEKNQETNKEKSCAQLTDTTTSPAQYWACETSYQLSPLGTTTITRRASFGNRTNHCEFGTCYCNTEKCNSVTVQAPKSLECYSCESADYFDNGCGEKLNPSSTYVQKVQGCSSCGKTVTFSNYRYQFQRGCARSVNVNKDNLCYKTETAMQCTCTGALCNSARGLQSITAASIGSALLVAVYTVAF